MTDSPNNTIASITDALANKVRDLGRQALEHGEAINKACNEYADRLLSDQQDLAYHVLTADQRVKDDIQTFIGQSSKEIGLLKNVEHELKNMTRQ